MKTDRASLIDLFEHRWDYHSARSVLGEALARLGLENQESFDGPALERIATFVDLPGRRAEWVAAELRRLAGGAGPAKPVAPAPEPKPAPAPEVKAEPKPEPKPAETKAKAKAKDPITVVVGTQDAAVAHTDRVSIVADKAGFLRWGVDGWKTPPKDLQPAGTAAVAGEITVETKLEPVDGKFRTVIGPFPAGVAELNGVVRHDDGSWAKDTKVALKS